MKPALSAPLPLWTTSTARLAQTLLRGMQDRQPTHALVENPYRTQPGLVPPEQLSPISDLPTLVQSGDVDTPIYLVGDDRLHLHQLRYIRMVPGLLVLHGDSLANLRQQIFVELDGQQLTFYRGFDDHEDLRVTLGRMSRGVCVATEAERTGLQSLLGDVPVHLVPELEQEPERAAERLLEICAQLPPIAQQIVPEDLTDCPKVTAVVIGYNSRDIVGPCLQTLLDQDYPNLDVVVVDNASADGTADFIREQFPSIRLIASDKNLGFAEGNNLVFKTTDSKYVALLNQDAYAAKNWITELVRCAELSDRIGSVGSKMLMHRCPTLLNSTAIEINEAGWGWDRQVGEKDENPSPAPEEVFGGCGGAVMYRKSALDAVGGFDPAFFMYYEDTDLAWRLRLAGFVNLYAPLAVVRHDFHGDTGATPGRLYRRRFMSERNRWATLVKNLDWTSLKQIVPQIRRYDRGRVEWLEKAVKDNHNPEFHGQIATIIKQAWRYNLVRLPQLWLRRRRTQKLRKVTFAELRRFIVDGINEGGHQGDVDNFHDRFSAVRQDRIDMGTSDDRTLGSGWHTLEQPPGAVHAYRWCKGRAWFYLQPPAGSSAVVMKLVSPLRHHKIRLFGESESLGESLVTNEQNDHRFELGADLPRDELLEFCLECETDSPKSLGLSGDIRDLGAIVFSIWAV